MLLQLGKDSLDHRADLQAKCLLNGQPLANSQRPPMFDASCRARRPTSPARRGVALQCWYVRMPTLQVTNLQRSTPKVQSVTWGQFTIRGTWYNFNCPSGKASFLYNPLFAFLLEASKSDLSEV